MKTTEPEGERRGLTLFFLIIMALVAAISISACSEKAPKKPEVSLFTWLQTHQPQQVQLRFDTTVLSRADRSSGWQAGTMHVQSQQGEVFDLPISVSVRGNSRRAICDRPPLKIRLDSTIWVGDQLLRKGKLKLVSPCLWGAEGEQLLHKELLAYELYQKITPYSFQTFSTQMEMVDAGANTEGILQPVFFLESEKDLYRRLEVQEVKEEEVNQLSSEHYGSFVLFQYFIGNTDWNLNKRHNLLLVQSRDGGPAIPIPYDFDQAGLVNAPYAKPYPTMPIERVTDRLLQWRGKNKTPLLTAIAQFQELEGQLMGVFETNQRLLPETRTEVQQFLHTFYLDLGRLVPEEEWVEHAPAGAVVSG